MTDYTQQELEYLVQFIHPQKHFPFLPGAGDDAAAAMFGLAPQEYRRMLSAFADRARLAAEELLADPDFADQVDRLPFAPGSTVVALGDSITDDLQSWCEILRHALAARRAADGITLVNAGISGDTTAALISRFLDVVGLKPDWILLLIGTNDARSHGQQPAKTMVSIAETAANLAMLRDYGARQTTARWVWITPATVFEPAISADWWLGGGQMMWRNRDMRAIAGAVATEARRRGEPLVDLQAVFGDPPMQGLLKSDGLHPALEGQKAILHAVVAALVR